MLNFIKEAKYYYLLAFKQYFNIKGKSTRKEFWYFFLVNVLFTVFLTIIDIKILKVSLLSTVYYYLTLIPTLTVSIRRLHDINKSGYYILLNFIPIVIIIFGTLIASFSNNPDVILTYTLFFSLITLLIVTSLIYYWFSLPSVIIENNKTEKLENNEIKIDNNQTEVIEEDKEKN